MAKPTSTLAVFTSHIWSGSIRVSGPCHHNLQSLTASAAREWETCFPAALRWLTEMSLTRQLPAAASRVHESRQLAADARVKESTWCFWRHSVSMFLKQIFQFKFCRKIALLKKFCFHFWMWTKPSSSIPVPQTLQALTSYWQKKIRPVLSRCRYFSASSHPNYLRNNIQVQRSGGEGGNRSCWPAEPIV